MKTLFFITRFSPGGVQNRAFRMAKLLAAHGKEVQVIAIKSNENKEFRNKFENIGVKTYEFNSPYVKPKFHIRLKFWIILINYYNYYFLKGNNQKVLKDIKEQKFDVVVAFNQFICKIAFENLIRTKLIPKLVWHHVGAFEPKLLVETKKWWSDYKDNYSERVFFVANSKGGQRFLSFAFSKPLSHIYLLKNYLEVEDYKPKVYKETESLHLIHVANFFEQKDYYTLWNACKYLMDLGEDFYLTVIGSFNSFEKKQEHLAYIDSIGIAERVIILEDVINVKPYLSRAHIGLLSSTSEGCPNVILEYMNARLPVIATNIEGIYDILNDSECLFAAKNDRDLARRIIHLRNNPNYMISVGDKNYFKFINYADENIVFDFYNWILTKI